MTFLLSRTLYLLLMWNCCLNSSQVNAPIEFFSVSPFIMLLRWFAIVQNNLVVHQYADPKTVLYILTRATCYNGCAYHGKAAHSSGQMSRAAAVEPRFFFFAEDWTKTRRPEKRSPAWLGIFVWSRRRAAVEPHCSVWESTVKFLGDWFALLVKRAGDKVENNNFALSMCVCLQFLYSLFIQD